MQRLIDLWSPTGNWSDVVERRHRWYQLKEAFPPEILTLATEDEGCSGKDLIVDPFCGSGTTVVSAALKGIDAIGFEVNPFLHFVAQAKLSEVNPTLLESNSKAVIEGLEMGGESPLLGFSTFSNAADDRDKWLFNREVLRAFEGGWRKTVCAADKYRHLLQLCLIASAMDVCNAVKDGKCLRYRKDWKELAHGAENLREAFDRRFSEVIEDLEETRISSSLSSIRLADSRQLNESHFSDRKFKLCLTSPPYLNSFDYTDIYRPELFLGKFVENQRELRSLRQRTVRSHVQAKWPPPKDRDFGEHFSTTLQTITSRQDQLWDSRIPSMIQAYFEDMKRVLRALRTSALTEAAVWMVVSTSAYSGVHIPVDLIIGEIGNSVGWFLREIIVVRHLKRASGQQWDELYDTEAKRPYLRESLIIFDASPRFRVSNKSRKVEEILRVS